MEFAEFILYLTQAEGVQAVFGFLMSFVFGEWAWYKELDSKFKRLLAMGLHFGVPVLAATIGAAMGYANWSFETTFWPALVAGFIAFTSGQLAHIRKL